MKFVRKKLIVSVLVLLSVCSLLCFPAVSSTAPALEPARVIAVNDGDTITIRMGGKEYRARLIGIDAPEFGQEPWGKLSREHLRKILKNLHWNVLVETDIVRYDKYNRLLIYVWDDQKNLVNEQMVLDGYAVLFTIQPNSRYADRFVKAQASAREKNLGIWGPDGLKERPLDYKKKHPRK